MVRAVIRKTLSLGLLAAIVGMGVGCTHDNDHKKTVYYHDHRRVPTGSNLPATYHDSGAAPDEHQTDMDREQFQTLNTRAVGRGGN